MSEINWEKVRKGQRLTRIGFLIWGIGLFLQLIGYIGIAAGWWH